MPPPLTHSAVTTSSTSQPAATLASRHHRGTGPRRRTGASGAGDVTAWRGARAAGREGTEGPGRGLAAHRHGVRPRALSCVRPVPGIGVDRERVETFAQIRKNAPVRAPAPPPSFPVPEGLGSEREVMLRARVERWWPDLLGGLTAVYGAERAPVLGADLVELRGGGVQRALDRLHLRDLQRMLRPDWLQDPGCVGYAAYTERFAGDLRGVADHLPYLDELGVRYLHLMPLLRPRDGDNDGGYAVADYRSVRPDLGTMDDLEELAGGCTRATSAWCSTSCSTTSRASTSGRDGPGRARRRTATTSTSSPTAIVPDAYERTLPEVFPDFAPGNFTWDDDLQGWVWTTFNEFQWDVNWANPAVLREYAAIILELANRGVDVLRLDAIAFMWKRLGTDCQGEPEVHAITQVLRARHPDRLPERGVPRRGDRGAEQAAWPTSGPARTPAR